MTIDPGTKHVAEPWTTCADDRDIPEWIVKAYIDSYRGPHVDEPEASDTVNRDLPASLVTPAMLAAHYRLGQSRPVGDSCVCVYPADDPAGFGPALQVVTDHGGMLMDSVTVLLHRLGVGYDAIMTPVFEVHRSPTGELVSVEPKADDASPYVGEAWIYVHLLPFVDRAALDEVERLLPKVLADVQRVARDAAALIATMSELAAAIDSDSQGHYSAPDREDVAALLRWLGNGNFLLLGYQPCRVRDGLVIGDGSSGLGVLRARSGTRPRLTDDDKLLVLAQAAVGSYLRYGAYPYAIAIRENLNDGNGGIIEHRFVGLFTVAAMNADVLEIPSISRRVREALDLAGSDPSHPGQLLLDVIQTVPRPELFTLSAERLLAMAKAVVDLGSERRALLFLRADRLQFFVSCLVYVPRDRYTTPVRLQIEDILVREFGGTRLEFTARVSESPWALMHFMVRLPEDAPAPADVSEANRVRIQGLLSEAARTWGDRLIAAAATGSVERADAEHYANAFSEAYKQVFTPANAIDDIAIINELTDDSVKLVLAERDEQGVARLTWYLGGHAASLSRLLPMLQSMGVVVLEERPFTVTRPGRDAGVDLSVQDLATLDHPAGPHKGRAGRGRAAIRRRGHGDLAGPRRDRPVQRIGHAREPDLAAGRAAARIREIPSAGELSVQPVLHRIGAQRASLDRAIAGHIVRSAFRPRPVGFAGQPRRAGGGRCGGCRHRRAGQPGHRPHSARVRVAGSGDVADQLLCRPGGFGTQQKCARPET